MSEVPLYTSVNFRTPKQPQSEALTDSGENIVVGGANRWDFSTFVNYDFFPSKVHFIYRSTSLIKKRTPLGLYCRPMPRVLGGF